jgi:hypothetical protein
MLGLPARCFAFTWHNVTIITPAIEEMEHIAVCHSGLSGIFLCFKKDSLRAPLAGMTAFKVYTCRGNNYVLRAEVLFCVSGPHGDKK